MPTTFVGCVDHAHREIFFTQNESKLDATDSILPKEISPFSAVITLQRFAKNYSAKMTQEDRGRLLAEISDLEKSYFAADTKADPQTAKDTLHRWHTRLGGVNPLWVP